MMPEAKRVKRKTQTGLGSAHGRPQKFFQGGTSRYFVYLFQVAGDATQMDVYKKSKRSMLRQQLHTVFSL